MLPFNPTTGNNYKGLNIFALMMEGREDPRWMTFKQAADNNWSVKKGEKGTLINYYKFDEQKPVLDENGKQVIDDQNKKAYTTIKRESPIVTSAFVFNGQQINGIPEMVFPARENNWQAIAAVESVVRNSGAVIKSIPGDRAFYSPMQDFIQMPLKEQFAEPGLYYATLLHELGHWSGHEGRLNRPLLNKFGTEEYAKEELRAEIGSLMLGTDLQIGHDPGRHAAYVANWIQVLKNDPFEIHKASADAQKIFDYVKGYQREITLENKTNLLPIVRKPATNKISLNTGEAISYKDDVYTVLAKVKPGSLKMESESTGRVFILKPTDNLYTNLIQQKEQAAARNISNPPAQARVLETVFNERPENNNQRKSSF